MAQLINLKLSRNDQSSPWGFRLQGGKDFGTPLLIQKVNFGSLAEKAGLQVGDALVRVNNQDVYDVKHKDAQDVILGAGNAFEVTIQRGGTSTWKPSVTPVGPSPVPNRLSQSPQILTKTSLAKVGPQSPAFGSSHNSVSRPYSGTSSPKVNSSGYNNDSGTVKAIVNKQYNTPVGIYSEENIAETLTAQAEVLAGGVLGVNFKKNEKNYEANKSEVFKMVQEADKEPRDLETDLQSKFAYFSASSHAIGGRATSPRPITPIAANMHMPEQRDPYLGSPLKEVDKFEDNAKRIECSDCRNDIIGVFVRIKDKSLHVECFKCATCGSSLKNVGYFNINNKLYCDIHAKMVARQNPPTPNLEPVTVAPGSNPPLGSFNIIPNKSKDVQSVQSPQPSTLSPIPFHAPKAPSHVNAPKQQTPSKVFSNAKPYEAQKQTPTAPIFTSGYNQVQTDESKSSVNSQPRLPFLKPKSSTGSAFCPVVSKPLTTDSSMCPTSCAKDVCRTLNQCKQSLSASISTQMLIESFKENRSQSPIQNYNDLETSTAEVPHEIRSLLPPNNNVRSISPTHLVIFPPEIPQEYRIYSRSKTSTPQPKHEMNVEIESQCLINSTVHQVESTISRSTVECLEVIESNYVQNVESSNVKNADEHDSSKTKIFDVVQDKPISHITITEPKIKSKQPVIESEENRSESPMLVALKTAPERSYSPLPTFVDASEFITNPIENSVDEKKPMTMTEALAIAPDRSYKLTESNMPSRHVGNNPVRYMHGYNKKTPVVPLLMTRSLIYSPASAIDSEEEQIASLGLKSFPPVSDELKLSTAAGDFDRDESSFDYVEELVFDDPKLEEPKELIDEGINEIPEPSKPLPRHPFTASGLHEPFDIPRYQLSIPENPHRVTPSEKPLTKLIGPGIQEKASTFTPKASIKNASFLKQETHVHSKVAPALGYEPSSLDGGSYKSNNTDPNVTKSSKSEPVSSNSTSIAATPKSTPTLKSYKESIPLTPQVSINDTLVEPVTPMPKSSLPAALLSKKLTCLTKKQQPKCVPTPIPIPDIGGQPTGRTGASAGLTAPRRGRGVLNPQNLTPGARVPLCGQCNLYIRGPFITALGKIWCPEHFVCTNEKCRRPLQDIGFVEEDNGLYCEYCFEQYLAPVCSKCSKKIKGDCLNAIGKQFHPECFNCTYCGKLFGNSPFFLEDSLPYCENDWNELFTTKCIACGFPIEAGDRWVEALNSNYHSPCFNCSKCKINLEGQSFYAKGGRPYCKSHAR
ncbi:PDZ and LIM domain protein Zasp isoform X2 [Rhopalosiphum maidis]|uniref:PDZ and LIM domain protein Zasp isoform X2 n=1 Tax=Rhopalosiphum maidis TaxID=43146 RepID=UPI000EFEFC0B|nr:PDZ and LIM domain protein Zasp isoform X2 [Rhopalosiphum maidis]